MSQLQERYYFQLLFIFKDIPNAKELNKYLFKEIKKWRKADPEGEKKTNSGFGWHSKTDMDKRKEYKPLIDELFKMAYECNADFGVSGKLGLGNMWANINPTYSYNKTHTHPNSMWSGVYYIKVPKNSGKLFLEDPRPGPNTHMPRRVDNLPEQLWRVCAYEPVEGRMIFFPSWLPHGVDINMNTDKGERTGEYLYLIILYKYEF